MASHCLLISFLIFFANLSLSLAQEDTDGCISFLKQLSGSGCNCDSASSACHCNVRRRNTTVEACLAAIALSDGRFNPRTRPPTSSGRQAPVFPPPGGVDYSSFNVQLGRITGLEEPIFHLQRFPLPPDRLRTRFFMSTNVGGPGIEVQLNYNDNATILTQIPQEKFHQLYVVAHDFNEGNVRGIGDYVELRRRLLARPLFASSAVVLVDWTQGARGTFLGRFFYKQAAVNTVLVGREVGLICYQLVKANIVDEVNIHFIGNGLGAQMLHFAARWYTEIWKQGLQEPDVSGDNVRKVGRFTALDPMAKEFQGYQNDQLIVPHVNRWDALKVDVIHTSSVENNGDSVDTTSGLLGMSILTGVVDVFVNGGIRQPGCSQGCPGLFSCIVPFSDRCHHQMALKYFVASISDSPEMRDALITYNAIEWTNYDRDRERFSAPGQVTNRLGIDADSQQRRRGRGIYSLPFVISPRTFELDIEATRMVIYGGDVEAFFTATRIFPENYVPPPLESGEIIVDFPPVKPRNRTSLILGDFELPGCGQFVIPQVNATEGRVIFGHRTFEDQFPWNVCLMQFDERGRKWTVLCTGALLNERYIATAAHCWRVQERQAFDFQPEGTPFYAVFGSTDCNVARGGFRRFIFDPANVFIFRYDPNDYDQLWDISLIRLREPLIIPAEYTGEPVNSICWRTASSFTADCNEELYLAGFGEKGLGRVDFKLTWLSYGPYIPDYSSYSAGVEDLLRFRKWDGFAAFKNYERNVLRIVGGGDSGGPFIWYIQPEVDDPAPDPRVSPYRAVHIATLSTGPPNVIPEVGDDSRISGPIVGVSIAHPDVQAWIINVMTNNVLDKETRGYRRESLAWPRPGFHR